MIPTNRSYIEHALKNILQNIAQDCNDKALAMLDKTIIHITHHLDYKITQQALLSDQKIARVQEAFNPQHAKTIGVKMMLECMRNKLEIQNTENGITSNNLQLNALVDSILDKNKVTSKAIEQSLHDDLNIFANKAGINSKKRIRQIVADVVKLYVDSVQYYLNLYFSQETQENDVRNIRIDEIVNLDSI
ncbi:hypothetical protein Sarmat_01142 [Rickettsiales endosymbiont of Paramecium tredecaurelia]|uniref:hypothetical protein n=1 Tax=Candidatus Sarmatiella mevalonica TaxID=2770581 RepID=UPI0019243FD3|nr:hypothetical protein [Candidatus Sarmatiella mevalonica]MBL3285270.1 hypothetical protein [Candidatus Sarmatiella mevalonica]